MSNTSSLSIQFTRIVNIAKKRTGKVYTGYDPVTGDFIKGDAGALSLGKAKINTVHSLSGFAKCLINDAINQSDPFAQDGAVYMYGIPKPELKLPDEFTIKSRVAITKGDIAIGNVISRTRDYFCWPSTSIIMLDFDVKGSQKAVERDELVKTVRSLLPCLSDVELLWSTSASSYIYKQGQTEPVKGLKGQRLYFVVTGINTNADQDFLNNIFKKQIEHRLWLSGYGRVELSASGSLLDRFIVDTGVWQPNRVDYVCGAFCEGDYYQKRPLPVIIPGVKAAVNISDISIPVDEIKASKERDKARAKLKTEAKVCVSRFTENHQKASTGASHNFNFTADEWERANDPIRPVLSGNIPIYVVMDNGVQVLPVKHILANKALYDGRLTLDPKRPWYDDFEGPLSDSDPCLQGKTGDHLLIAKYGIGREVGKLLLTVSATRPDPVLHSMASGSTTYVLSASCIENIDALEAASAVIDAPDNILDSIGGPVIRKPSIRASSVRMQDASVFADWLRAHPHIFVNNNNRLMQMVHGDNGRVFTEELLPVTLRGLLNRGVYYFKVITDESTGKYQEINVPVDPDCSIDILNNSTLKKGYKPLNRIVNNLTFQFDKGGRLTFPEASGYVQATGDWVNVDMSNYARALGNRAPSLADAKAALSRVMEPFSEFNIVDDCDRGGLLAALMTAAFRQSFELAPMVLINANRRDCGKSLMSQCLARLTTAYRADEVKQLDLAGGGNDSAEMSKLLLGVLTQQPSAIIFDNTNPSVNRFTGKETGIVSSVLANILTSNIFEDRVLGTNMLRKLSTGLLWVMNGINIRFQKSEMVRRVIPINLAFKTVINTKLTGSALLAYFEANRLDIINDLLIILLAFHNGPDGKLSEGNKDRFSDVAGLGSYEDWDSAIRHAVLWISDNVEGYADPVIGQDNMLGLSDEDAMLDCLIKTLTAYYEAVGEFMPSTLATEDAPNGGSVDLHYRLRVELSNKFGLGNRIDNDRSIGRLLAKFEGLKSSSGTILRKRRTSKGVFWYLETDEAAKK